MFACIAGHFAELVIMLSSAVRHVGRVVGFGALLGVGFFLIGVGSPEPVAAALATNDAPPPEMVLANAGVKTVTNPLPNVSSVCAPGMVEVDGDFCPYVEQKCLRWLDPETKMRCAEFGPTSDCPAHSAIHKHFCVDQYEYPNVAGSKPQIMVTFNQAQKECSLGGKRLCGESEWTLACEGAERLPYPYGYARNAEACNIDRPHPDPNERLIADPRTRDAEVARLDQRDPSGAHDSCVSPFGAYDMTGNVDEWVVNESGHPHKSGLKGGYWGPVRDRCRPMTTAHDENFAFYQIGFRCCSDPAQSTTVATPHEIIAGS
jgi:sulfatase modifying factor 1